HEQIGSAARCCSRRLEAVEQGRASRRMNESHQQLDGTWSCRPYSARGRLDLSFLYLEAEIEEAPSGPCETRFSRQNSRGRRRHFGRNGPSSRPTRPRLRELRCAYERRVRDLVLWVDCPMVG